MRTLEVEVRGEVFTVHLREVAGGEFEVRVGDGAVRRVRAHRAGTTLLLDDARGQLAFGASAKGDQVFLQRHGQSWSVTARDPRKAALALAGGGALGDLRTEMPGAVVRVPVAVGDEVREGQVVVVVEAMKMENEFKAPYDGVVEELPVSAGQTVEAGTLLARIGEVE